MKIESDYYQRGQSLYSDIDKIIINLQDESNSDTSEDSQRLIAADRYQQQLELARAKTWLKAYLAWNI